MITREFSGDDFWTPSREFISSDRLDSLYRILPLMTYSLLEFRAIGYLTRPDDHFYPNCHLFGVVLQSLV